MEKYGVKFITHYFPPDFAATGQFVSEIAHSLAQEDLRVSIFTSQPAYAFDQNQEQALRFETDRHLMIWRSRLVKIWSSRVRGKTLQGLFFCLRCFLFFLRPRNRKDLFVVTTAPPFLPVLIWAMKKAFGIRYVCITYDLYPDVANELGISPHQHPISRLWRRLNCHAWKNAEAIVVLNESMRDRILEHYPYCYAKIHVLHNWADHHRIQPIPKHANEFAHKNQLQHQFVVLYSGNLGRCHDGDTIFQAAEILKDQPIQFVFIGGGANLEILKAKVQDSDLTLNIRFLPYQKYEDLPKSLASCDVSLVSIAKGFEGLVVPSKLYSSLAVGRPVAAICEEHSYLVEILEGSNSGQTFRSGEAQRLADYLLELSQSPELLEQQGANARQYLLDNFTRELITADYKRVLMQILQESMSSPKSLQEKVLSTPQR